MKTQVEKTVREVALETAAAPAVLESLGIDYCCGGQLPFDEACRRRGLAPEQVLEQIQHAAVVQTARTALSTDWKREPLTALITHIVETHHIFVRSESPRLLALAEKVAAKHGERRPTYREVLGTFRRLAEELHVHLLKEEQVLFPYIERLEESSLQHESVPPSACFQSVASPINMMLNEHDNAGEALRQLRALTGDYQIPADACMSTRALLQGLAAFEADLHQHIHLENNILFPRTLALAGQ